MGQNNFVSAMLGNWGHAMEIRRTMLVGADCLEKVAVRGKRDAGVHFER